MMQRIRRIGFGLFTTLAIGTAAVVGFAAPAPAADERLEVSGIKAVRTTLVDTQAALQKGDIAKAKEAFDAYDSAWNGIEVYIDTRSKPMYDKIELDLQARINKELIQPMPDLAKLRADIQEMLGKYDEAIAMVSNAAPLNPLFDDIARLRIERAHLREVIPALKAGNFAKARKSYEAFDANWDSIEDLIKARSADAYVAVEKGMIQIEQALMADKPDVAQVTALVTAVNTQYNAALAMIVKDAKATVAK
jgi:tetratricopeptide (TPR) repeat protein